MPYVLHVDSMTYKTYDIHDYIFVHPEEWFSMPPFFGIYLFHPLDIAKTNRSLEALRFQLLGRATAVFSMVLGFILIKTCVH